jgi:hypothetical protein
MAGCYNVGRPEEERGWKMIEKYRMTVLFMLAVVLVTGLAMAQAFSGAGAWTSGCGPVQITGGAISAGPGGVKTFTLGSSSTSSITSVSPGDAQQLQNQGVRVVTVPASKTIYVSSQAGQALDIRAGDRGIMPNMIVFGPAGFVGTGVWAGPGTGAFAGTGPGTGTGVFISPGGVSISAVPGAGASVQIGGGAGAGASRSIRDQTWRPCRCTRLPAPRAICT